MKYRRMVVWSSGSENAKTAKMNTVGYSLCFILLCIFHVSTFVYKMNDDKITIGVHIFFGIFFLIMIGWLTLLMLYSAIDSFKNIKKNKLISLYLYRINEFSKIGEIPDDKFVLFSDESGVVLADKKYEDESINFSFGANYFYEFEEYYEKHAVIKEEITY